MGNGRILSKIYNFNIKGEKKREKKEKKKEREKKIMKRKLPIT